jgi:serine/threonine protein kinase
MKFDSKEAVNIVLQVLINKILLNITKVAKGILELNTRNVMHRDIKPENIVSIKSGRNLYLALFYSFECCTKI